MNETQVVKFLKDLQTSPLKWSQMQKACRFIGLLMILNALLWGSSLQTDAKETANWTLRWAFVRGRLESTLHKS